MERGQVTLVYDGLVVANGQVEVVDGCRERQALGVHSKSRRLV